MHVIHARFFLLFFVNMLNVLLFLMTEFFLLFFAGAHVFQSDSGLHNH